MTIEHVATRSRPESRDLALKDLLWAGIAADAPKTLEAIRHLESPVLREELERRALHIWTESDPAAAVAWAHAIPDTAESSQALDAICTQMSESDPRVALEALIDADDGQSSMALIENVAGRWASEDFDTARHWAEIQDDGPVRDRLIQRIAFARVGDDPVAAATLVATQIPPGAEQEEAIIAILHQWAIQDVTAAEEWVHAFPAGPVRDRAIREIQSMRLSQTTASAN